MIGRLGKRIYEKGITLLEALVSTAIIGIGFVAIFQMVNYSVQSIDISGERTKSNYLVGMVAEDLLAEKNSTSPSKDIKLKDVKNYEEIILIGSGKAVTSVAKIEKLHWKRKSFEIFHKLKKIYNKQL